MAGHYDEFVNYLFYRSPDMRQSAWKHAPMAEYIVFPSERPLNHVFKSQYQGKTTSHLSGVKTFRQ